MSSNGMHLHLINRLRFAVDEKNEVEKRMVSGWIPAADREALEREQQCLRQEINMLGANIRKLGVQPAEIHRIIFGR